MHISGGFTFALLLIAAFLGWGRFLSKIVLSQIAGTWAIQAAWGICVFAILGGILNAFGWVSRGANLGLIGAGIVLLLMGLDRAQIFSIPSRLRQSPTGTLLALTAFAIAACVTLVVSLFPMIWDTQDDSVAYAVFPTKMLQTGTLIEPFSHRRIIGYGAHAHLQSLVLSCLSHHELPLLDQGIATVLAAALITAYARKRLGSSRAIALVAGIAFMWVPPLRINLSAISVFSLLSLALLETWQLIQDHGKVSLVRRAVLLAFVSAALIAMRANAVAVVGSLLVFLALFETWPFREFSSLREQVALLALAGVFSIALLLPWAVTLYRSSGTPFYPLIGGFYNRAIVMSLPIPPRAWLSNLWQSVAYSGLHFLVIVTVLGVAVRALPRALTCYSAATLATALAQFAILSLWGVEVLDRYYSPFLRVAQVLTLTAWSVYALKVRRELRAEEVADAPVADPDTAGTGPRRIWSTPRVVILGASVLACGVLLAALSFDWKRKRDWREVGIARSLEGRVSGRYKAALPKAEAYRAALATIPKGAHILAQVDAPFLLNFREHEIFITDDLGVVSPPPGLPSSGEPEALVDYLRSLSIDHLMFVNPKAPVREGSAQGYHLDWWNGIDAQHPNNRLRAPYFLWFLDAVMQLSTLYEKLYDSDDVVVLSLKSKVSQASQ